VIGQNDAKNCHRYNVLITRLCKDGDEWKMFYLLGRNELPLLAKIANMAHSSIFQHT